MQPLGTETVSVTGALDRVLAADAVSPIALPPWNNSAMDGYACRSADLSGASPVVLRLIEEIPAGTFPSRTVHAWECARISTGAPIPNGADCVIRQEDTSRRDDGTVQINDLRDAGRNVRRRGEDITPGDVVVAARTALDPGHIGVLVSAALDRVGVVTRPTVAFLASGDEIADLDDLDAVRAGRKIASSNSYALDALIRRAGGIPLNLGIARDDAADIGARLERARGADLVLTSAGVSVGEHDYLHQVLDDLDVQDRFWRIRMRPGAPVGFGRIGAFGGTPWLGLPGNPVSTMVTFELFARPAIRRLGGHRMPFRRTIPVTVGESIRLGPRLRHFLRVTLEHDETGGLPNARLTGPQGSHILTSMVKADALLIVPEDSAEVPVGTALRALVLNDPVHVAEPPW
jgi:molybdopterin molybdotransferase